MSAKGEMPDDPERKAREEALREAIREHLRTVGSREWAKVRERPEFAAYYGKSAGDTGDRQFWRIRAQVVRQERKNKTRPHDGERANAAQRDWAQQAIDERRDEGQPLSPAHAFWMRNGKSGEAKIDAALAVRQIMEDAQRLRNAAVDARGDVLDHDKLARAVKLQKEVLGFYMDIQPDLARLEQQKALMKGLVGVLKRTHEDDPERLVEVMTAISEYLNEWGLPTEEAE